MQYFIDEEIIFSSTQEVSTWNNSYSNRNFSALGTPYMPLQASISVASPGGETAQSHVHIHSYPIDPIDPIDPLCGHDVAK